MDLDALYKLTHGLYVLGARDENRFAGSIVDAVMQVANKPVAIALSCSNGSYTKQCIEKTAYFHCRYCARTSLLLWWLILAFNPAAMLTSGKMSNILRKKVCLF